MENEQVWDESNMTHLVQTTNFNAEQMASIEITPNENNVSFIINEDEIIGIRNGAIFISGNLIDNHQQLSAALISWANKYIEITKLTTNK